MKRILTTILVAALAIPSAWARAKKITVRC